MKAIFILLLLCKTCRGQPAAKQFVFESTSPIRSINANDEDYSDLQDIGQAIGNKRIVMLGELYHGDTTTIQAKTRLVKFLHEKMGLMYLFLKVNSSL